ncbi:GNAT family N-acetyltransferase [Streptomyces sp. IMTB 2501]|uniref:GNAT family N-acetyltransferase n=1 Tax=Streptomyces sp. IMTB 2501 TaxID=1776340 RepID=UPI0026C75805|nr:GNAT family N-acetyltransferase [Streptomyces sp. IMTB 2501]
MGDESAEGKFLRDHADRPHDAEAFAAYVQAVRDQARSDASGGDVPRTNLWFVEGAAYLGRLMIRHALTHELLKCGGHIGYNVRPSARRRGHATAMLMEALPVARGLGIASALLTCDADNHASRKVIETCGGVLEDERDGTLRFWLSTGAVAPVTR